MKEGGKRKSYDSEEEGLNLTFDSGDIPNR